MTTSTTATKKKRSLFLLAAVVLVSAVLAAPTAEATRYLPEALTALKTPPPPVLDDIDQVDAEVFWLFTESDVERFAILSALDASEIDQLTAGNRIRLFPYLDAIPRPIELAVIQKLASGFSTCAAGLNVWETGSLAQDCGSPSFQGLWTDPVTGIAYARNRWYDARNASWLSEDPKGAVDSVNLYAFVAWGPHMGRDPLGTEKIVVSGGEYTSPKRFKYNFITPAITQLNQYVEDAGEEPVTWLVFEQGYSENDLKTFEMVSSDVGVELVVIQGPDDLSNYLNSKSIDVSELTEERSTDKVSSVAVFSHGIPCVLEFAYGQLEEEENRFRVENIQTLDPEAFDNPIIDLYSCGPSNQQCEDKNGDETSFSEALADHVDGKVSGYRGKSAYGDIDEGEDVFDSLRRWIWGFDTKGSEQLPGPGGMHDQEGVPSEWLEYDQRQP